MKTFAIAFVLLATAATTADASSGLRVTIHAEKAKSAASPHHTSPTANAKAFAKFAHMKATPWEADLNVKAAKCEDLCLLQGFYTFQEGRNCLSRPTDLCMQYKMGRVAAEMVIVTAECTCANDSSSVDSASGSDDDDTIVEVSARV